MKQFDLYDILGFLAPGAVAILGIRHYYPGRFAFLDHSSLTLGDLGAFVLLAYIAGNLVAGLGTMFSSLGVFGSFPTDDIKENRGGVITASEFALVEQKLKDKEFVTAATTIGNLPAHEWGGLIRRIHAYLDSRGLTRRVEMFNARFGLNRNLVVAFVLLLPLAWSRAIFLGWAAAWADWNIQLAILACAAIAYHRMREFARVYAQALIRTFLVAPEKPPAAPTASDA